MKLDNFSFSGHQGCPLWYDERINKGWTVRHRSAALGFGGAIHAGLAEWHRSRNPEKAVALLEEVFPDQPVDDWRDLTKCKKVLLEYMNNYTYESFTIIPGMIEVPASLPTGMYLPRCMIPERDHAGKILLHPSGAAFFAGCEYDNRNNSSWNRSVGTCRSCGAELELIEYGGIFDTLVEFSGQVYILEHKTTTVMGNHFFNQFKPNNQVTGYVWLAKGLSGRCDGALINAIGLYKSQATRFERQISTRNEFELDEWLLDLWTEACDIRDHELFGHWPMRTKSCTLYGACEFLQVHSVNDPSVRQRLLEQDYVQDQWQFEKRDLRPS